MGEIGYVGLEQALCGAEQELEGDQRLFPVQYRLAPQEELGIGR